MKVKIQLFSSPLCIGVSIPRSQQYLKGSLEIAELALNELVWMSVEASSSQAELHCVLDGLGCVDITYFDHKLFDIRAVILLITLGGSAWHYNSMKK